MTDKSARSHTSPRVGIFGGTFNPVHECHLTVAEAARKGLDLDRICFVPAGTPPVKRADLAPAADRLEMVRIATRGRAGFEVSDVEIRRDGPSYTIDTLTQLKIDQPEVDWTFVLGLDAVLGIGSWHRPDAVLRAAPMAVLYRAGASFGQLRELPQLAGVDFAPLDPCCGDDPTVPMHLFSADGIHLILVPILPCPASGTDIRAAIRAGESHPNGLSGPVSAYIMQHHLYV